LRTFASKKAASKTSEASLPTNLNRQLVHFASVGNVEEMSKLLSNTQCDVNQGDYDNRTALHLAAAEGQNEAVDFLLKNGADVNAEDRFGNTPLEDAIASKSSEIIEMLRAKGAKMGNRFDSIAQDLCFAAHTNNVEQLQILIEAGADPNATNFDQRTAMHVAASDGHVKVVEALLAAGASFNVLDRFGNTPLHDAERSQSRGSQAVVKVLREAGAVSEALDVTFAGPAFQAAVNSSLPILCQRGQFQFAEVWFPSDSNEFVCTANFVDKTGSAKADQVKVDWGTIQFKTFHEGVSLGNAYDQKQPLVFKAADISPSHAKAGWHRALVVPIQHEKKIYGLLRFFTDIDSPILSSPDDLDRFRLFAEGIVSAGVYRLMRVPAFSEVPPSKLAAHSSLALSASQIKQQMQEVYALIVNEGVFSPVVVFHEVDWFYNMGVQPYYFKRFD